MHYHDAPTQPCSSRPTQIVIVSFVLRFIGSLLSRTSISNGFVFFQSFLLCRFVDHPEFKTIITVEGQEETHVDQAVACLLGALPTSAVLRVEKGASSDEGVKMATA